jgi:hypothetical protein
MLVGQEFHVEKYYGTIVSSQKRIIIHKIDDSWENVVFQAIYQFR